MTSAPHVPSSAASTAELPSVSGTIVQSESVNTLDGTTASNGVGTPTKPFRYTKIQPAIAIKPKPVPIAMLPKPVNSGSSLKFDSSSPQIKNTLQLNVNTSKKWVLPPRPRPGRKPATNSGSTSLCCSPDEHHERAPSTNTNLNMNVATPVMKDTNGTAGSVVTNRVDCKGKISPKKKQKIKNEQDMKTQIINQLNQQYPRKTGQPINSVLVGKQANEYSSSADISLTNGSHGAGLNSNNSTLSTNLNDFSSRLATNTSYAATSLDTDMQTSIRNLKRYYCNKIKEQQLVQNYIDVLSNQIKELRFVQNGVITVDALVDDKKKIPFYKPTSSATTTTTPPAMFQYEQLEKINNLNDLNKFLSYLTKSSNIIHSVTKNYNQTEENLDLQINHYLESKKLESNPNHIKSQHSKVITQGLPTRTNSVFGSLNANILKDKENSPEVPASKVAPASKAALAESALAESASREAKSNKPATAVTPALIVEKKYEPRTLHSIKEGRLDFETEELIFPDENNFAINEFDDYVMIDRNRFFDDKRSRVSGCEFCGSGTPCLCLDSDILRE